MAVATTEKVEAKPKRKTVRFTIDFDEEQHHFLKSYALQNQLQAALVIRALVYMLEIDENVANDVVDEVFDYKSKHHEKEKTIRFTIDFDAEQHRFLKLFSLESRVQAALIIRSLVKLLKVQEGMSDLLLQEIFGPEED